jgi:hypothetical protein
MISRSEISSRIQLCKELARREPANQALWMAEAGNWSRLSKEKLRGEAMAKAGSRILVLLQAWSARFLSDATSASVACMEEASQKHERSLPLR